MHKQTAAVVGFAVLSAISCRRDFEAPAMETELLIPLLTTSLSIDELVPDSLSQTEADGSVTIVYRNELLASGLGAFEPLETKEFNETAKLQKLSLSPRTVVETVSLGQVAEGMGVLGAFIVSQNGQNMPFPALANLSHGPILADATSFFESVSLDSGYMDVTIHNGFPTALNNIDFEIRNQSDNSLVGSETFATVAPGATQTKALNLAGKTVEGTLEGFITNFDVAGTGAQSVLIDTTDRITVTMTVRDMKVNEATAIFPAQDVISLKDTNRLNKVGDLRITRATARTGFVQLKVISTVEDTLYFHYIIPGGQLNGVPFEIFETINPAPSGGSIERQLSYSVSGYEFDLTGSPLYNATNAFYSELTGRIDSTGKIVNISLDDSLQVIVQLTDFVPEYAEGYLGHEVLSLEAAALPITLFNHTVAGSLEFEKATASLAIENQTGVEYSLELSAMSATNTRTGKSKSFALAGIPNPLYIEPAPVQGEVWSEEWALASAEDVNELISIFPNRLNASMLFTANPAQDSANLGQFASDSAALGAYLDISLPLHFSADGLTLRDTLPFDASALGEVDGVLGGVLYLTVTNTMALAALPLVELTDASGNVVETIEFDESAAGGTLNNPTTTTLQWAFGAHAFGNLLRADEALVSVSLNTNGDAAKLYSTDRLKLQLSCRLHYDYSNE